MKIIIHQSLCGENNKAWDLLKTTIPDNSLAKSIAFKADIQDQAPSGISWLSALRGFVYNEFFLLMKTYLDTSPEVRPGRAFTHVLIISKTDLQILEDISPLLEYFSEVINKDISLKPITFNIVQGNKYQLKEDLHLRFNKTIHGFTEIHNYKNTIIWIGQENYEEAVCKFWQLLSLDDKLNINFGINFNASQIPTDKINFITTPENLENKFFSSGYFLIRKSDEYLLTEFLEQFLAGEPKATERINNFRIAIDAGLFSRFDIEKISKGINTFETIATCGDLKKLNTLSHIIAEYSTDENKGLSIKNKLLMRIKSLIEYADVKEIFLLRIFRTNSFQNSENVLIKAIYAWIDRYLFSLDENKKKDLTFLVKNFYETTISNWWYKLFKEKITNFLNNITIEGA